MRGIFSLSVPLKKFSNAPLVHLDIRDDDIASAPKRTPHSFKLGNGRDVVADQRGDDVIIELPHIRDESNGLRAERGKWVSVLVENVSVRTVMSWPLSA